MIVLETVAEVEYGLLEQIEVEEMVGLLAEAFSRYDAPAVAVGLSAADVERLVSRFGQKALSENLTVLARETSSGELVGGLLVEDFGTPPPEGLELSVPTFAPIGALLDSLDSQYRAARRIVAGTHLHLFMLGVADRASGRGIAQKLIATCLTNGKARGYGHAITEATGSVSQHVFRKLGFRDILFASYKDFLFNGEAVFSSIVGPEATILMERDL